MSAHSKRSTFTHRRVAVGLISESTRRLRGKRAVADIFAREFLLTLISPPVTGARNRSSQGRPQSLPGTATRRRISWPVLHVNVKYGPRNSAARGGSRQRLRA